MRVDQYGRPLCSMCGAPMVAQPHYDRRTPPTQYVFECRDCAASELFAPYKEPPTPPSGVPA